MENLPKLEKLTLQDYNEDISDEVLKHLTKLKSLELLDCLNVSSTTLTCMSKNCLELQNFTIKREFLIVKSSVKRYFPLP